MSSEIKCPVCGKVDIPDYHSSDVVCPCCGSDLKIYRVIETMPANSNKNKIWKSISAATPVVVAAMVFIIIHNTNIKTVADIPADYSLLKDSIESLNKQLAVNSESKSPTDFSYTIKKGDSLWSISQRFYGSGTQAYKLADNNNKKITDTLHTGEVLIIK